MSDSQVLGQEFSDFEVSIGTLNETDLIKAYHEFLNEHYAGYDKSGECEEAESVISILDFIDTLESEYHDFFVLTYNGQMALSQLVNETLPDMINELSPIDHYFGSHVGSSADIGFWPLSHLPDFETDI